MANIRPQNNRRAKGDFVDEIQAMETRAYRLGLIITARALNQAMNAAGWELAGDEMAASLATKGERPA
jgi:hypothetical protein